MDEKRDGPIKTALNKDNLPGLKTDIPGAPPGDRMLAETGDVDAPPSARDPTGKAGLRALPFEETSESAVNKFKNYLTDYGVVPKKKVAAPPACRYKHGGGIKDGRQKLNPGSGGVPSTSQGSNPLGQRRDLNKTKRDIEKDKFNKTKDDIVKKLETGLIPPGMEMEAGNVEGQISEKNHRPRRLSASPPRQPGRFSKSSMTRRPSPIRYCSPIPNRSADRYVLMDKHGSLSLSPSRCEDRPEHFFVKDEYFDGDFLATEELHSRRGVNGDFLRYEHEDRRISKERIRPPLSQYRVRRPRHFNSRERFLSEERRSNERILRQRLRSSSRERFLLDKRRSKERILRQRPRSFSRERRSAEADLARRRRVPDARRSPIGRQPLRPSRDSGERLVLAAKLKIRPRRRSNKDDRMCVRKSLSREKVVKEDIPPMDLAYADPPLRFQVDVPVNYPNSVNYPSSVSSDPPPYFMPFPGPPLNAYPTFEHEHLPPQFDSNSAPPYPYMGGMPLMYKEPEPIVYMPPPSQPLFYPPAPQIQMSQPAPAPHIRMSQPAPAPHIQMPQPVPAPHIRMPQPASTPFVRMTPPAAHVRMTPPAPHVQMNQPAPRVQQIPTAPHVQMTPPSLVSHPVAPKTSQKKKQKTTAVPGKPQTSLRSIVLQDAVHKIQYKPNNQPIAVSTIIENLTTPAPVSVNHNSRYDSQIKFINPTAPLITAKERHTIEDTIKRCAVAIEKLEYLHLPNRIHRPSPKETDTAGFMFSSPMIRDEVVYDFTTKSSNREKPFLVASIVCTLDLDVENIHPEPSIPVAKYKTVAVQTAPFTCDACVIANSKGKNMCNQSTMTDMPSPVEEMPPTPPPPTMSLMYLTPANILDPGYIAPQQQQHIDNSAAANVVDVNNFSRRTPYNTGRPALHQNPGVAGHSGQLNPVRLQSLMEVRQNYQMYNNNYANYDPSQGGNYQGYQ